MIDRRIRTPRFGPTSLVVFLVFALVLAGVLAYQAQDAARSHRDAAERALEDYASLAAWEFARQAKMRLRAIQMTAFFVPAVEVNGSPASSAIPTATEFASSALEQGRWCRCLDSVGAFFRMDLRDGVLTSAAGNPLESGSWLQEQLTAHALADDPEPEEAGYGRAPFDPDTLGAYVFRGRRAHVTDRAGQELFASAPCRPCRPAGT